MGYMNAIGECLRCNRMFSFNPARVPTFRVNPVTLTPDPRGVKEPLCRDCFEALNRKRVELGIDPWPLDPSAYEAEEVL